MFTHIFKRERFINPTPAAEAKLLGEKMARNAAFREVRAQAIKRRLDEGEALGSRAAAGRGTAAGVGSGEAMLWGRSAGCSTTGTGVAVESGGRGTQSGRQEEEGAGAHSGSLTNDLSPGGGRLRIEHNNLAPSHSQQQQGSGHDHGVHSYRSGSGGGARRADSTQAGGQSGDGREGGSKAGGASSSDSSRAAGNKAREKQGRVRERASGSGSGIESSGGGSVEGGAGAPPKEMGPGRNGSTSGR